MLCCASGGCGGGDGGGGGGGVGLFPLESKLIQLLLSCPRYLQYRVSHVCVTTVYVYIVI